MPIVIPHMWPISKPPRFPRNLIASDEWQAAEHIHQILTSLATYEQQFRAAVLLVDCCQTEFDLKAGQFHSPGVHSMDSTVETLSNWMLMAARDGALAIYHFGSTMDAIRQSLPHFRTLRSNVDHPTLRFAQTAFRKAFPRYEAIRHVVSHAADFRATPSKRMEHSHQGPINTGAIQVSGGSMQFSDNLFQRTYVVSYEGKAHSYEIAHATADKLFLSKLRVYSSLGISTISSPAR